jgi:protein TonB
MLSPSIHPVPHSRVALLQTTTRRLASKSPVAVPSEHLDLLGGSGARTTPAPARRFGRAVSGSLLIHAALVLLLMWAGFRAAQVVELPPDRVDLVYLSQAGPGGGGGGNPAPTAPARLTVPRSLPPPPVPTVQPTSFAQPLPDPILTAPVTTNLNDVLRSNGLGAVTLGVTGGGVKGTGPGSGVGDGIDRGTGGNFGGGPVRPGNGCTSPQPIVQAKPNYTTDAMRAKIQGDVTLDVIVRKDGAVGDMRITQSLDRMHGLDQEALKAAKAWTFRPATCKGDPVDMVVSLILEFRLH